MKRRRTKKLTKRIELRVAQALRTYRQDRGSSEFRQDLNTALITLIGQVSHLHYASLTKSLWVDDLEWSELSAHGDAVRGAGVIWWGYRNQPAREMTSTPFEAVLQMARDDRDFSYVITFEYHGTTCTLHNTKRLSHSQIGIKTA